MGMGTKRVVDAFLPLLQPGADGYARIVNVGSGSGPMYVQDIKDQKQKQLFCSSDLSLEQIVAFYRDCPTTEKDHYGLSKALLPLYTMYLARTLVHKNILSFCLSPGFIATNMTKYWGATKQPSEGTVSLRHCLFKTTPENNGWFYGSDAKRSPLHFLRNPGEPEFNGVHPW